MDKETLSHYGWIVIVSLVLAIMIALATPFGVFVGKAVSNTVRGFAGTAQTKFDGSDFDADQFELDYNKDKQEWEGTKSSATNREAGSVIPDGAAYTPNGGTALIGNGTNTFPDTVQTGDTYEEGDYVYKCNYCYGGSDWFSNPSQNGWGVRVKDASKTSYGEIVSEIVGKPTYIFFTFYGCHSLTTAPAIPSTVTDMTCTFYDCTSLTTAPVIPSSVTNMTSTFDGCTSLTTAPTIPNSVTNMNSTFMACTKLTTAPVIPNSVTDMSYTFWGCKKLTTAPTIPNSVTDMSYTFNLCSSLTTAPAIPNSVTNMNSTFSECPLLTGTIEINTNPTSYKYCLQSTQITGITGSCSQATKGALLATK